ncbi:MAG: type IX secretion system membrane protein PorP/SprF [Prevotellaceae bacterium]|jgi:type IX secretion system PorP/SprF family membrane protein|nr:type IX secretion system membrane protein PorP/SprF [Prevotellaceae bacterium]
MKVALPILLLLAATPSVFAQEAARMQRVPTQYYAHRQLTNPAAMSDATAVDAALYGQYRLYGFEGAPKEATLQVTVPFSTSSGSHNPYYFSGRNSAESDAGYSMFFGVGAYGTSIGAYSEYSALLSYAYQIRLSQSTRLGFGVALGATESGRRYDNMPGYDADPSLASRSSSAWQFHAQAGMYLHGDSYYVSAYSPAMMNKQVFLQAGYSVGVGRSDEGGYYEDASQKKNRWEVHAQAGWVKGEKMLLQGSTLYTINSLLGVGVAWQNPLNLAALAQLQIGGMKICYAYQIADFNTNILQHEIILKFIFSKKENLY